MNRKADQTKLINDWASAPENSARTVLVTIFGDTIAPTTDEVWLAQLFQLTDVLGFTDRLVRTSVFRLASDGWLHNERVGRQSRYRLTELARNETKDAEQRIYQDVQADWSGPWSTVFVDAPLLSDDERARLKETLAWHGFMQISSGTMATPTIPIQRCRELCLSVTPAVCGLTGTFDFDDLDHALANGFFDDPLALDETADAYRSFTSFYASIANKVDSMDAARAFAIRTMLVHDLRRVRLRSVDLPTDLLPADWPGAEAGALASELYHELSKSAAPWLSQVLKLDYPDAFPDRLAN